MRSKQQGQNLIKILQYVYGYVELELDKIANITMGVSPNGNSITDIKNEKNIEFHQGKTYFGETMLLQSNVDKLKAMSNGSTFEAINSENIRKFIIFLPPLEEQQRIVDILDRFDKLCNDISEGLPAEIEARQKQYEYYREKLLSFKKL